jgi:hypothetical protein
MESVSWRCLRNWHLHCRCQHRRRCHWCRLWQSRRWLLLLQVHPPLMLLQAVGQEAPHNHLKTMVHVTEFSNKQQEISTACSDELGVTCSVSFTCIGLAARSIPATTPPTTRPSGPARDTLSPPVLLLPPSAIVKDPINCRISKRP